MKNILVFPCGSEIALEINRSLVNSTYFRLIGANSISDHGEFVFENYIGGIPFVDSDDFIPQIKEIVKQYKIDYIYPAMDSAIEKLKYYEEEIGCMVVSPPIETAEICLSKEKTYEFLDGVIKTPICYDLADLDNIKYPAFCKPKIGYGARGAKRINDLSQLKQHLNEYPDSLIMELLTGDEYTIDCFTDRDHKLLFCGPRKRNRISNGISVNTFPIKNHDDRFRQIVEKINSAIEFRGAWFVQLKENSKGDLVLLEIASRLGGSSSLFRAKGINFAQLTLFDAMGYNVDIIENDYDVVMDRALYNKYKIDLDFTEVFIDYDDTLILKKQYYNVEAIKFIYECKNRKKKVTLLSSHDGDLDECLKHFGLTHLFDRVIHITKEENKADRIDNLKSIFIDDSFSERKRVAKKGIPVFSLDMIETLF